MNSWVGFFSHDIWITLANVVNAMKKWPGSQEPTETGVNLAHGTNLAWFDFLQQDQDFAKRYSLAMEAHGGGEGFSLKHTVDGYPWGEMGDGTVVDVSIQESSKEKHFPNRQTRWAGTKDPYLSRLRRNILDSNSWSKIQLACVLRKQLELFLNTLNREWN